MNNVIELNPLNPLNPLDPIINEYESFADKTAGLKTIAFKYFSADINKASEYLKIISMSEEDDTKDFSIVSIIDANSYYQPELI